MNRMKETQKYPHWKDALFGGDTIANIRCAIKYTFWHLTYLLMGIVGAFLVVVATVLGKLGRTSAARKVGAAARDDRVKKAVDVLFLMTFGFVVVGGLIVVAAFIILHPFAFLKGAAMFIGAALLALGLLLVYEKSESWLKGAMYKTAKPIGSGAKKAGSKAVQTPGVRRVYGECPVSWDIEPKWFDKIFGDDEL